ncbi:hypothetical protein SXANM310S_00021 [Streptomyces xanthochromogenes]
MANKKQLERVIRLTERELAAIERRDISPLTMREKSALLAVTAGSTAQVARGKGAGRMGRAADRYWDQFEAKRQAELAAARQMLAQIEGEQAAARVTKKARGWSW